MGRNYGLLLDWVYGKKEVHRELPFISQGFPEHWVRKLGGLGRKKLGSTEEFELRLCEKIVSGLKC